MRYLQAQLGWQWIFWVSGIFGLVWLVLFGVLVTKDPESHPYISDRERQYIISTRLVELGSTGGKTPWLEFFRHRAVWGVIGAHFAYNYMSYLALSLGKCPFGAVSCNVHGTRLPPLTLQLTHGYGCMVTLSKWGLASPVGVVRRCSTS